MVARGFLRRFTGKAWVFCTGCVHAIFKKDDLSMPSFHLDKFFDKYMFSLRDDNDVIVLQSSDYGSKQAAVRAIALFKPISQSQSQYLLGRTQRGQLYFYLTISGDEHGWSVTTSRHFASDSDRAKAIEWVKKNAPGAPTKD